MLQTDLWFSAQLGRKHIDHARTTCCFHTHCRRKLSVPSTRSSVSTHLPNIPCVRRSERHVTRPAANQQPASIVLYSLIFHDRSNLKRSRYSECPANSKCGE